MENVYSVVKISVGEARHTQCIESNGWAFMRSYMWTPLDIKVPAELKLSENIKEGERLYKSTLTFTTSTDIKTKSKWIVFKVELADGTKFCFGNSRKPFPLTTRQRTLGAVTGSQMYKYTSVLECTRPLPIINHTKRLNASL
ncbi:MAG: hypothetical protein KBT34_01590 [Prevotella sp.]|nr:hypothetical protein [Candidatus Prevotella equi]